MGPAETIDRICRLMNLYLQEVVYKDLGESIVTNALAGFNCSLFAYGYVFNAPHNTNKCLPFLLSELDVCRQTGSGKSYSMIGYAPNHGIVVKTCDNLFGATAKSASMNPFVFWLTHACMYLSVCTIKHMMLTCSNTLTPTYLLATMQPHILRNLT